MLLMGSNFEIHRTGNLRTTNATARKAALAEIIQAKSKEIGATEI